jgi:bifunctional ADP-heptose synthase (sugar kinase/adenylyltransferase)
MDTRSKILTMEAALELPHGTVTLAAGYFDALHAAHVRELAVLARPVLALVLPCPGELLPQRARAEMTAALRVIDYVVIAGEEEVEALIARLAPRAVARLEAGDTARVRQLMEHVHRRQTR